MKTPEEIKKGLKKCYFPPQPCEGCPYYPLEECSATLAKDALACIVQLEEQIAKRDRLLAALGVSIWEGDQHESV